VVALPGVDLPTTTDVRELAASLLKAAGTPQEKLEALLAISPLDRFFAEPEPLTVPEPPTQVARYRVRVDLRAAKPPVWRRLELDGDLTLDVLHVILQEVMGWYDSHLHAFRPPGVQQRFLTDYDLEVEGEEGLAEAEVRLDQVLLEVGDRLEYEYDFGDGWDHLIRVEEIGPAQDGAPVARCLAGRGACPPEDIGGVHRYNEVAAALRGKPGAVDLDPELRDWLPLGFEPDAFDVAEADAAVRRALESPT
jgi:Plasmid pRiA4b ORF-3-like protein